MRQRVKMTVIPAVVLALIIGVAPAFGAGQVTELLGKVQDDKNNLGSDSVQWTEVTEAFVKLGPAAVQELVGMVMDPVERGKKNASDLKARYALHAIALHVARPGSEAERAGFARAVAAQLAAQHPPAVKGFLIRQLRFAGGPETVQALGALLMDESLCEYAAQALVSIKTGAAEQFRQALKTAKGPAKLTIIQGLGVLRDREAVSDLLRATADEDAQLRRAALSALGNIGDPRAAEPLKKATAAEGLYERAQATDALLLLATRLTESGRKADAADIYGDLWTTRTEPGDRHVRCAALLGLAVTTGGKAVPLLQEAMKSKDPEIRAAAIDAAVTVPGEDMTRRWAESMESPDPAVRTAVLRVLGERGDRTSLAAAERALKDADAGVRMAAIHTTAAVGGADAVPPLIEVLDSRERKEQDAAKAALLGMKGEDISGAVVKALPQASAGSKCALLSLLAQRGAKGHLDVVLTCTRDADESVRVAAIAAVGSLGSEEQFAGLLDLLVTSKGAGDLKAAEKSIIAICGRATDRETCEGLALSVLPKASVEVRCALMRILGQIGGAKALDVVRSAASDANAAVRDCAIRSLADWPDTAAADALLPIAQNATVVVHKVLALRGYTRLAGLMGDHPEEQVAMYKKALASDARPEEKKQILSGLGNVMHVDALELLEPYLSEQAVQSEVVLAVVKIAPAVSGTHRDRAKAALGKVLAVSKDKNIRKQAQDALNFIEKDEDFITAFLVSGPYTAQDKGPTELFDISFPPEQAGATGVKWRAWSGGTSRVVDLAKVIGGENRVGYVRAQLWSPKAGDATLEIGTDDGVKVWLNGEVVHSINALRGLKEGQDKIKVKMEQGWNPLLVKVTHGTVFWQVYVRVRAADGTKLEGFRFKAE